MLLYGKKSFIMKNIFTEKNFFTEKNINENVKNMYLISKIYFKMFVLQNINLS